MHGYVRSLAGSASASEVDDSHAPEEPNEHQSPQSPEPAAESSDFGLNPGSLGHPVLCQRPCVHVAVGRACHAGTGCDFCHFHHSYVMKLDRVQRHMVEQMSKAEFLTVALQLLREKAEEARLRGTEILLGLFLGLC